MIAAPMSHVAERRNWLVALRRYLVFAALANLLWEFSHLPSLRSFPRPRRS